MRCCTISPLNHWTRGLSALFLLFLSLTAGRVNAQFDNLADIPRHVAISEDDPITRPQAVFAIPESDEIKPYALRVQTADAVTIPPESLTFNGMLIWERPIPGRDNNWHYFIAPAYLRVGENRLETPERAIALEMVSLESAYEVERFTSLFPAPVSRSRRVVEAEAETDPEQLKFDALDYDLTITLDMTRAVIPEAVLTMTALSLDSSLTTVPLDFDEYGGKMVVSKVSSDDDPTSLTFYHENKYLYIILNDPVPANTTFTVTVAYSGRPNPAGLYFPPYDVGKHGAGVPIITTTGLMDGALAWWPCKYVPLDRATVSAHITCPTAYTAVSNGLLTDTTDNGDDTHTFHWRESYPMGAAGLIIACTNYNRIDAVYTALDGITTMGVSHYNYPEAGESSSAVNGTVTILEYFARTFGEYPFLKEKFSKNTWSFQGGTGTLTCVNLYPGGTGSNGLNTIYVHEISHQYFASLISIKSRDHLWLFEGLASYSQLLFKEDQDGVSEYYKMLESWNISDEYPIVGPRAAEFNQGIIYHKGAWVLHMLRRVVGDVVFFQAIRNYVADPELAYSAADSADLQAHFETAYGQDLSWFFDEWLYRAKRPRYRWAYRPIQETDGSWSVALWAKQIQSGDPYIMPIDLEILLKGNPSFVKPVFVERGTQVVKIPTGAFEPRSVKWDPDNWVLDTAIKSNFPNQALWIDALSLDFGPVAVGQPKTLAIAIENLGTESLHVTSLTLSGSGSNAYSIVLPKDEAFDLPPGPAFRKEILIQYSPDDAESIQEARLTIQTSDTGETYVDLTGRGGYALNITVVGSGKVTSDPEGSLFDANTTVTLIAVPFEGRQFVGWSGDAVGTTSPLVLTLDGDQSITATFAQGAGIWTWMKGSADRVTTGTYGTLGVPGLTNTPAWRYDAVSWTDDAGAFWLFGGGGGDSAGNSGRLNDLWKYNPNTGEWAWMKGSDINSQPGIYGTLGVPDPINTPGARINAVSWTDDSGAFWLFGGSVEDVIYLDRYSLNDLWKYDPATGDWTWMHGSDEVNQPGIYGEIGIPDPANTPGARDGATSWVDGSGALWLFGGFGSDSAGDRGSLNDLWKYDPDTGNWTWMKGADTESEPGVYGVLGVPDPANTPSARTDAVSWIDDSGALWLFGGSRGNDLWKYNPATENWTWMKGADVANQPETYGALGVPDPANNPSNRSGAVSWTDASGSLWLFSGIIYARGLYDWSDYLWKYDPDTGNWTCMKGSEEWDLFYGTLGVPDPANNPEGCDGSVSWADDSGALWLFGGYTFFSLNGLWKYDPDLKMTTHTLVVTVVGDGTATTDPAGSVFDTNTTVTLTATPRPEQKFTGWTGILPGGQSQDNPLTIIMDGDTTVTAHFEPITYSLLVGATGDGVVTTDPTGSFFNANTTVTLTAEPGVGQEFTGWTGDVPAGEEQVNPLTLLMDADRTIMTNFEQKTCALDITIDGDGAVTTNPPGSVFDANTVLFISAIPDAGFQFAGWSGDVPVGQEQSSRLILTITDDMTLTAHFGAPTYILTVTTEGNGSVAVDPAGPVFEANTTVTLAATPGTGRKFGGWSGDVPAGEEQTNPLVVTMTGDLSLTVDFTSATREFEGNWTWMKGSDAEDSFGIYGMIGVPDPANTPSARTDAVSWTDASGAFWLFGGYRNGGQHENLYYNDLWKYNPAMGNWTCMQGSDVANQSGTYGALGVSDPANTPGGRSSAVSWIDQSGALWLSGGYGYDSEGTSGTLNDLWKYGPGAGNWTWISGSDEVNQPGVYGTLGVTDSANSPGARRGAVSWADNSGMFWLFGGYGYDSAGGGGRLNDLWRYNPAMGNWTWIKGSDAKEQLGIYGALGVPDSANTPGARSEAVAWTDNSGALWLFGGWGQVSVDYGANLNDLWKFDPVMGNWTWMKGSDKGDQPGTYGVLGVPASSNTPRGRANAVAWIGDSGILWLFGGRPYTYGLYAVECYNDLWAYNPASGNWTWKKGSEESNQYGVYGNLGLPDLANTPGARSGATFWIDDSGALWLLGGNAYYGHLVRLAPHNDLWKYTPAAEARTHTLTINIDGDGAVATNPEGSVFDAYTTVTLTATPGTGQQFTGWSGPNEPDDPTLNPLTLLMDADKTLTATFEPIPVSTHTLSVFTVGNGRIDIEPDSAFYRAGSTVTLTAIPDAGYSFTGWSGDAAGTSNPLTVTMDNDKNITANYEEEIVEPSQDPVAAPTNVQASDGAYLTKVVLTWDASTSLTATHYQVKVSDGASDTFTPWQTEQVFVHVTAAKDITYTYSVAAAEDDVGTNASAFSATDTGFITADADKKYYKVSYTKAAVTADEEGSLAIAGNAKGTLKVKLQKRIPKNTTSKEGKYFYLFLRAIPTITIAGDLKKLACDAPVIELNATGVLKSITTKENIQIIGARQIGSLKMTVFRNDKQKRYRL